MYEGKERIKERVGEREHSFKLLLVQWHQIKHTVLVFSTKLDEAFQSMFDLDS